MNPASTLPPVPVASADLRQLLVSIMERVSAFIGVERTSLFLWDEEKQELWTPVAQGLGDQEIRIGRSQGIAGHVFSTSETLLLEDPYADPRFNQEVDRRTGFRTRNLFCRPLLTPAGRRLGVIQLLNKRAGAFDARDAELLDAFCAQAAASIENAQLYLKVKRIRDSEARLLGELEGKHAELRDAFLRLEEASTRQELLARRMGRVRLLAVLGGVLMFALLAFFAWRAGTGGASAAGAPRPSRPAGTIVWHTVAARPLASQLVLSGTVEPVEVRNLTATFRGRLAEKFFAYGELVTKDQLLARFDPTDLDIEIRNARAALYRAGQEVRRLEEWEQQPEVARGRRAVARADLELRGNERNLREMEQLAALGIIAASSLESARQQFAAREADHRAAQDDLANLLAQATPERIAVVRYDVENARLRLQELETRRLGSEVRAPYDGIVLLPNARPTPGRQRENDGFYDVGVTLDRGDTLLAVGSLEGLAVKARADEVDILRLRHGQPVRIAGDAFGGLTLRGEVAQLSSQAIAGGGRPYFEVVVRTGPLSVEERAIVRLGMTARLAVSVYENPAALVVPATAVLRERGEAWVWVAPAGAAGDEPGPQRVKIEAGATTPEWVEVRGLAAGQRVAVRAKEVTP